MKITRRLFLKKTAAAGGYMLAGRMLDAGLEAFAAGMDNGSVGAGGEWIPTTCWIGKQDCGILARRIGGRIVKLEGHPDHPLNQGTLCPKGVAQIMAIYDPNRVKTPLLRKNKKGEPGEWESISWDEALTMIGERIKELKARDPRLILWQKGRSKAKAFYDEAFVGASKATKLHHGAFCSDAGYRACEYTIGPQGVLHPDFRYNRYLLAWGWNITNAGGNKLCWLTWPRQLIEARERGMKVIAIDPRLRGAGPFADEWIPIRPGTDLALALSLCHVIAGQGTIDKEYLIKYTNAPFIVREDGTFFRLDNKEAIWDMKTGSIKSFDSKDTEPALEGDFKVDGLKVKTSFQMLKDHLVPYTPEWASGICDIPPETIRRLARELAENAQIGRTIVVDGVTLPFRPVAIMAYHMAQQELGFQTVRGMLLLMMLLGAIEAVGGQRIDFAWKVHENYNKLDEVKIKDPPYNIYLKDSKFFPINSNNSSIVAKVMQDPKKYGVDYIPELLIIHMANPLTSFASQPDLIESYKKFKFIAVIDPWLSRTADLFADLVLPAATMEKYEGPLNVTDQYTDAVAVRIPPMKPLFDSRGEIDIYLGICEKAGMLYGKGGYLDELNRSLKLKAEYTLPLDKKPVVRDIFDRWARSEGIREGISYFEKNGIKVKGPVAAKKYYGYAADPPFSGIRHRLYGESLLRYQTEMKAKGVEKAYWTDYTPLPVWRRPTMEGSPSEYNLYLISYKLIEFKQSRSSQIPLLAELAPRQWLEINPVTAGTRGIIDGDEVWIESHNTITGETRKMKVTARYREGIRPDTVGVPHHYGDVARHPWADRQGPTPNLLYFTGVGYVTNTADQSFHVKVRVYKA